ncbi:MAG: DUF4331 family protein [Deltaproteobacteria bacterium]|nr:DUF4331 family protein [Deltaproteobacteria bacterium]
MKLTNHIVRGALALALLVPACGDNTPECKLPGTTDGGGGVDAPPGGVTFRQVEHLARPVIAEALLISDSFLAGYNATAPTFSGVPMDTLNAVVGEVKTVLKAFYLGTCLINGALGLTPATGLKPAGLTCHAVGPAIWTEGTLTGVTLTPASQTAAQAYADKVFDQFVPDVMRLDTAVTPSFYQTLCGDANTKPLLCGGRFLRDDTIDITYDYLLNGAATPKAPFNQFNALVSDSVNFSLDDSNNAGNRVLPVPNPQQGHPNVSNTFPYSAAPF